MNRATVLPLPLLCALALLLSVPAAAHSAEPGPNPDRKHPGNYRVPAVTVLALDKESISVRTRTTQPQELKFAIDPKITQVFVAVVTAERTDDQGHRIRQTRFEPGTLDDLEVGRDVYIGSNEDKVAVDIILPPKPPAKDADNAKERKPAEKK